MDETQPRTNIIVIYGGTNLMMLHGRRGDTVKLKPGRNVINLSLWQRVTESKGKGETSAIDLLTQQNLVRVLEPEAPRAFVPGDVDGDGDTDISAFNAITAIEIVKNTFTDRELDALEAEERADKTRKTVLAAIEWQRQEINPADDT